MLIFLFFEIIILSLIVRYEKEVNALNSVSIKHISRKVKLPAILLRIAKCESGDRQFNSDGSVLRGKINPLDVGRFQINEKYHLAKSRELGMNIYTIQGNTAYALWLYKKNGTKDWDWSKYCWDK